MGFVGGNNTLDSVLRNSLGINHDEFEGSVELLNLAVTGDWIVRKPSSAEDRLKALEEILKNEMGKDIHFVKRTVDREVIVAGGKFDFRPLSGTYNDKEFPFFSDTLDKNEGAGGGTARTVADLLSVLGDLTEMQVINETIPSEQKDIVYGHHQSAFIQKVKDPAEKAKKLDLLLANLSKQTNLVFHTETRPIEKWFVEKADSVSEGH